MNRRILIAIMPLVFALSLISIFIMLRWPLWEESLMSDQSPAAWLSSAQLFVLSFLAFRLGLDGSLNYGLSIWLGTAMAYLSIDEQFMLHEHWKYGCSEWLQSCTYAWVRELPMIGVAVIGISTMVLLARNITERVFRIFLYASLGCGALALLVDLTDISVTLSRFEEAIEVSAEALLIGAFLVVSPVMARHCPETRPA